MKRRNLSIDDFDLLEKNLMEYFKNNQEML